MADTDNKDKKQDKNNYASALFTEGMALDSHPQFQAEGTHREALNIVDNTDEFEGFPADEDGNELCAQLPNGFIIRGYAHIPDRNQIAVISYNFELKQSEIGILDLAKCTYVTKLNDKDLECKLICGNDFIDFEVKLNTLCNEATVYWSDGSNYKYFNLDTDYSCKDCSIKCRDLLLMPCEGTPVYDIIKFETGGQNLKAGTYRYFYQLEDELKNKTNWFKIPNIIALGSANNVPGELTREYIRLSFTNISSRFNKIKIAVVKTIAGKSTSEILTTLNYSSNPANTITFEHRGDTEQEIAISLEELLAQSNKYIVGKRLIQYNGRLILYSVKQPKNHSVQKLVNDVDIKWVEKLVPASEAHKYKTLRRGEVYAVALRPNYCDGTFGPDIHLPGRKAISSDMDIIPNSDEENCTLCDKKRWELYDTSFITDNLIPSLSDVFNVVNSTKSTIKYLPKEPPAIDLTEEWDNFNEGFNEETANLIKEIEAYNSGANVALEKIGGGNIACPEDCIDLDEITDGGDIILDGEGDDGGGNDNNDGIGNGSGNDNNSNSNNNDVLGKSIPPSVCTTGRCGVSSSDGGSSSCSTCGGGSSVSGKSYGKKSKLEIITSDLKQTILNFYSLFVRKIIDNCVEGDIEPLTVKKGRFGYWESTEVYPMNTDHECDFVWGDNAGQPIRHHKVPSSFSLPHVISLQNGVPNLLNLGNDEETDTYVSILGIEICKIPYFDDSLFGKPLDPNRPFELVIAPRNGTNKTVLASGNFFDCFKGEVYGEEQLFPKHAVNSLEYFDKSIFYNNDETLNERGGESSDIPAYTFMSPDTQFDRKSLNPFYAQIDLEMSGTGFRHGSFSEGEDTGSVWVSKVNQKGVRQHIHLNKINRVAGAVTKLVGSDSDCNCNDLTFNATLTFIGDPLNIDDTKYILDYSLSIPNESITNVEIIYRWNPGNNYLNVPGDSITFNSLSSTQEFLGFWLGGENIPGYTHSFEINVSTINCEYKRIISNSSSWTFFGIVSGNCLDDGSAGGVNVQNSDYIIKCVQGVSYVDADTVLSREGVFTYPLNNLHRESSVFLEFKGQKRLQLANSIDKYLIGSTAYYNGRELSINNLTADASSDASFIGQTFTHEHPIYNAATWYGHLRAYNPRQYGNVEGLSYVSTGVYMDANARLCGKVEGLIGDSFINKYTYVRKSFVSDRVGFNTIPDFKMNFDSLLDTLTNASGQVKLLGKIGLRFLRGFLKMLRHDAILSFTECGRVPVTRDVKDKRNFNSLRNNLEDGWDGIRPFSGFTQGTTTNLNKKAFYPNVQKTLITTWVESDVNVYYRQAGNTELGEVHSDNLKELKGIDSYKNNDKSWKKYFLNKFHWIDLPEVSLGKKIGILLSVIALRVVLPLVIFIALIRQIIMSTSSVRGWLITILTNVILALIIILIARLFYQIARFLLERYLVYIFALNQCKNDNEGEPGIEFFNEDYVDNYHRYNYDYSDYNYLTLGTGIPSDYVTNPCIEDGDNLFYISNKQLQGSYVDAYKNYQALSYQEVPKDFGFITNMFVRGNKFLVQTTDMIYTLFAAQSQIELTEQTIFLGRGSLFEEAQPIYAGPVEGAVGCSDPFASINALPGYFFIDRKSKSVYIFNDEFTNLGLKKNMLNFFFENLDFKLLNQFPDYKNVDKKLPNGIGYSLGYDARRLRVLITKIDYEALNPELWEVSPDKMYLINKKTGIHANFKDTTYFCDKSFTISYNTKRELFRSFHSYLPYLYLWDRGFMYSMSTQADNIGAVYKHSIGKNNFTTFYNNFYPSYLEACIPLKINGGIKHIEVDVDSRLILDDNSYPVYSRDFYNQLLIFNSDQSTGVVDVINKHKVKLTNTVIPNNVIPVDFINRTFRFNNIKDRVQDYKMPILLNSCKGEEGLYVSNDVNLNSKFNSDILLDKYVQIRLISSDYKNKDVRFILKSINVYYENEII